MRNLCAVLLALAAGSANAQTVLLQGTLGSKALLIIEGGSPKALASGETHNGVKVVSVTGDQAVVEVGGKRLSLRVGDAPAHVGGAPVQEGKKIVLPAGSGGHFMAQGRINGRAVQFMVDTGATSIAMSVPEAERLGIDYKKGRLGRASTANGVVQLWAVKLASVRIGEVEIYDVDSVVVPASMPYILLGNSFLSRFQMRRENDTMVLERRF
jgi:aspartyl protease family protein